MTYSGMYNNGDANSLQYIFNDILQKQQPKTPTQMYISQYRRYMRHNIISNIFC